MKKLMTLAISAVMVCSLAACGAKDTPDSEATPTPGVDPTPTPQVQIPNPFVDCKTMDEAAGIAGFTMTLPESVPNWVSDTKIRAVKNDMIEVIYSGDSNELRIRKGADTEDISGDFNDYETTEELTVKDMKVTIKGSEDRFALATWTDGEHAFAISVSTGMTKNELSTLVSAIA